VGVGLGLFGPGYLALGVNHKGIFWLKFLLETGL